MNPCLICAVKSNLRYVSSLLSSETMSDDNFGMRETTVLSLVKRYIFLRPLQGAQLPTLELQCFIFFAIKPLPGRVLHYKVRAALLCLFLEPYRGERKRGFFCTEPEIDSTERRPPPFSLHSITRVPSSRTFLLFSSFLLGSLSLYISQHFNAKNVWV